jgi:hypothetical protein
VSQCDSISIYLSRRKSCSFSILLGCHSVTVVYVHASKCFLKLFTALSNQLTFFYYIITVIKPQVAGGEHKPYVIETDELEHYIPSSSPTCRQGNVMSMNVVDADMCPLHVPMVMCLKLNTFSKTSSIVSTSKE